jgi:predicted transposase/invertase (TIGR01784 family)
MQQTNQHDRFAKSVMSVRANALDFFSGILPQDIKSRIDLSTLTRDPTGYIDNRLAAYFSDIVFTCSSEGGTAKIALLFEHKSSVPPYPHVQLLRYILNIWEKSIKENDTPPLVIPVVLYHGRGKWRRRDLQAFLSENDESFKRFIPGFEYILIDLSAYSDEWILAGEFRRAAVRIWLLVQKYIFRPSELLLRLKKILDQGILYFRGREGSEYLESVFRYILLATDIAREEVAAAIERLDRNVEEVFMTTGEKLIQEGIVKGTILDKQHVLMKQLSRKFGLTEAEKELITSVSDPHLLDSALDEFVFADTKEKVLQSLR